MQISSCDWPLRMLPVWRKICLREGTFFIVGGGGGGPGVKLVSFLQIWEGQTWFIRNRGRVTALFGKEKITPGRLADSY